MTTISKIIMQRVRIIIVTVLNIKNYDNNNCTDNRIIIKWFMISKNLMSLQYVPENRTTSLPKVELLEGKCL